jgi:hypothetical protein
MVQVGGIQARNSTWNHLRQRDAVTGITSLNSILHRSDGTDAEDG